MSAGLEFYRSIGGAAACRAISEAFHARVATDPVLRPLFPGKSLRCATHQFTAFLIQFLGGPVSDGEGRVWVSLQQSHLRFRIGVRERDAWMAQMRMALAEAGLPEGAQAELTKFFEESSAYLLNDDEPPRVSTPHAFQREWKGLQRIDAAVVAIQAGDASLIDAELVALANLRTGRTLLHEAAGRLCRDRSSRSRPAPSDGRIHRYDRNDLLGGTKHALQLSHLASGGHEFVAPRRDLNELNAIAGINMKILADFGGDGDLPFRA